MPSSNGSELPDRGPRPTIATIRGRSGDCQSAVSRARAVALASYASRMRTRSQNCARGRVFIALLCDGVSRARPARAWDLARPQGSPWSPEEADCTSTFRIRRELPTDDIPEFAVVEEGCIGFAGLGGRPRTRCTACSRRALATYPIEFLRPLWDRSISPKPPRCVRC